MRTYETDADGNVRCLRMSEDGQLKYHLHHKLKVNSRVSYGDCPGNPLDNQGSDGWGPLHSFKVGDCVVVTATRFSDCSCKTAVVLSQTKGTVGFNTRGASRVYFLLRMWYLRTSTTKCPNSSVI